MDAKMLGILILILTPVLIEAWRTPRSRRQQEQQKLVHYHSKRHMQPRDEIRKSDGPPKPREMRKKPSGNLAPLEEDDIDNEEVISVAVGPPPLRALHKANAKAMKQGPGSRHRDIPIPKQNQSNLQPATEIIKNILTELGKEFLSHQVTEEFIFGQYIGNSMKNLTSDLKIKMQHEVLDLIVKYHKLNRGEIHPDVVFVQLTGGHLKRNTTTVDGGEDTWPDFKNLAKIVD